MLPFLKCVKGGSHENNMLFDVISMEVKFCGSPDGTIKTILKIIDIFIKTYQSHQYRNYYS